MADYIFTGHSGSTPAVQPSWETAPSDTAFAASNSVDVINVTGNAAVYTIIFDTETYDIGTAYNNATGLYTAPSDGLYSFTTTVGMENIAAAMTQMTVNIVIAGTGTSVGTWTMFRGNPNTMQDLIGGIIRVNGTFSGILDAGDTASIIVTIFGGAGDTATLSGDGVRKTWFSGYKINSIGV